MRVDFFLSNYRVEINTKCSDGRLELINKNEIKRQAERNYAAKGFLDNTSLKTCNDRKIEMKK